MSIAEWMPTGACSTSAYPETWFMTDDWAVAEAKRVCAYCTVRDQCLEFALATSSDDGVFGGMTGPERKSLRRKQARQKGDAA